MKIPLERLFIPSVVSVSSMVALFIVRGIVIHFLKRWTARSETSVRTVVLRSLRTPSIFWCIAIGLYFAVEFSDLPRKYVNIADKAISILLIFSATVVIANLAVRAFENYTQRSDINIPATGIILGVFRAAIIIAGILVILNFLGISIAPLLTALGVGGLAVALALKDTLSNLFAGLHIIASKQVRPGDHIKLNSGEEGVVTDITWRSTTITSPARNIIIVP
ncbi:MAG: integral rane protein, partial [Deltaproteobacteria bacterium]|nr:integral rane protein [Deltaproteobacteria bacterium]